LYDQFHINFVSHVPRPLLEELARLAIECDGVSLVSKVTDQYLNFVSLEDTLFHLNQPNSYVEFHDPSVSDAKAEKNIDDTVDALFSVVVTMVRRSSVLCSCERSVLSLIPPNPSESNRA
jgi:hypothetical protein